MKAVQSIGIFGAISSATVSTLNAIERGAVAVSISANSAVTAATWANEEIEALREDRAIRRDATREIWKTKYILEASAEVAQVHAEAKKLMANADPEVKAIYDAMVAKHLK